MHTNQGTGQALADLSDGQRRGVGSKDALRLADLTEGKLEIFFEKLEEGNAEYEKIWDEYLDNLAIAVDNLRMCFDCEVVLGGYVGNLIGPYVPRLRQMVADKNLFGHD